MWGKQSGCGQRVCPVTLRPYRAGGSELQAAQSCEPLALAASHSRSWQLLTSHRVPPWSSSPSNAFATCVLHCSLDCEVLRAPTSSAAVVFLRQQEQQGPEQELSFPQCSAGGFFQASCAFPSSHCSWCVSLISPARPNPSIIQTSRS